MMLPASSTFFVAHCLEFLHGAMVLSVDSLIDAPGKFPLHRKGNCDKVETNREGGVKMRYFIALAIVALVTHLTGLELSAAIVLGAVVAIPFAFIGRKKKKKDAAEIPASQPAAESPALQDPAPEPPTPKPMRKSGVDENPLPGCSNKRYRVIGTAACEHRILALAELNPMYSSSKTKMYQQNIDEIYKYVFHPKRIELIPDPDNPYNPQSVMVVIDEQHVGYVKDGSCAHVLNVLRDDRIRRIQAEISGGPHKYLEDNGADYDNNGNYIRGKLSEHELVEDDGDSFSVSIYIDEAEKQPKTGGSSERRTAPIRPEKGKSLIAPLKDFVVIDVETTGYCPAYDELIEVGAIRYRNGKPDGTFTSLVKPKKKIPTAIEKLTGITNEMLSSAPPLRDVLPDYLNFIGADVVVGHNVNFDVNFIYDACLEIGINGFGNDFVDTLRICRRMYPDLPNHKLDTLAQHFHLEPRGLHRSLKDCTYTAECYIRMMEDTARFRDVME